MSKKVIPKSKSQDLRITKISSLPSTSILIIKCENQVLRNDVHRARNGKYGVPVAGAIELPSEETHRDVGEVSSLTIREDFRQQGGEFFLWMINFLCTTWSANFPWNPLWLVFIQNGLIFMKDFLVSETLDSTYLSNYKLCNGNPLTVLKLDLENFEKKYSKLFTKTNLKKNFYSFYKKPLPSNILLPQREIFFAVWIHHGLHNRWSLYWSKKDKTLHRLDENENFILLVLIHCTYLTRHLKTKYREWKTLWTNTLSCKLWWSSSWQRIGS